MIRVAYMARKGMHETVIAGGVWITGGPAHVDGVSDENVQASGNTEGTLDVTWGMLITCLS